MGFGLPNYTTTRPEGSVHQIEVPVLRVGKYYTPTNPYSGVDPCEVDTNDSKNSHH